MISDTARKAVDWYLSQNPDTEEISIGFFGGEPLLNFPLIQEVVSYVKEKAPGKKLLFGVTTNATLLNDEIIDFLRNEGITPLISFDGTPEYQRHNRILKNGRDSHDIVIQNVRRLMKKIPQLPACATLWGDADEELVLQTLKDYGFTNFWTNRARPSLLDLQEPSLGHETLIPENDTDPAQCSPEEETMQRQTFISLKDKVKKTLEAMKARDTATLRELVRPRDISRMLSGWQTHLKYQYCGVGRSMLTVAVDGKIYPCHCFIGLEKFCLGSINTPGPVPRKFFETHQIVENKKCQHCFARFACGGSCAYENYGVNGDIYHPTPEYCAKKKAWIEFAIYLDSQMNKEDRKYLLENGFVRKELNIFDLL